MNEKPPESTEIIDLTSKPKPIGMIDLMRKINEITESPIGKLGMRVIEKELDLKENKGAEKGLQKYAAYRFLYAARDFINGTALTFIGYSVFFVILLIIYRYAAKVLGV